MARCDLRSRRTARGLYRDRLFVAQTRAVQMRAAGDARMRLEGAQPQERDVRRADLLEVLYVAGAG